MKSFESPEQIGDEEGKNEASVDFIRHSVSSYKTYIEKVLSDNPMGRYDYDNQATPDLPEKGIEG